MGSPLPAVATESATASAMPRRVIGARWKCSTPIDKVNTANDRCETDACDCCSAETPSFLLAVETHAAFRHRGDRAGLHDAILGTVFRAARRNLTPQYCDGISGALSRWRGSLARALQRAAQAREPGELRRAAGCRYLGGDHGAVAHGHRTRCPPARAPVALLRGRPCPSAPRSLRIRHYTGLIAALLFLLLLAISNDVSLRRFGPQKWKSLQRWTYLAVTLTVLHGVAYQHIEKRETAYAAVLWSATGVMATFQVAGWRRMRKEAYGSSSGGRDSAPGRGGT
jgi:hypothetical protein